MDLALLALLAAALLGFGSISRLAERSIITPPMVFVALGWAVAAYRPGGLEVAVGTPLIHGLAELTLVLVLFTDATRIDLSCLRREESLPLRLLTIALPATIGLGTLAALWLVPGLGLWECVLLAAVLAPTDAALGQAVVSSPRVPLRIRQTLNVESGLNDGIALPLVLVAASLAGAAEADGALGGWLRFAALQMLLGPLVGFAVGHLGGLALERATASAWINGAFERLAVLGLAGLAYAGAELVGGNGFIAAFVAGLALGASARSVCACLTEFGEAEGQLLTLLVFFAFGAVLVPEALEHFEASFLGYALLSLTLVRMLPVAVSLLGTGLRPASFAFLAWFGPRGLASMLFALLVVEETELAAAPTIAAIAMGTVLLSTFAHGASAYPLAALYGRRVGITGQRTEHGPVQEHPVRIRHATPKL